MKRKTELISFRATVVEVETYDSNGKKLYHAVLDSLEGEPQRQAQFFGLEENQFKVGDVHVVTFSQPVARSSRKAQVKTGQEIKAERVEAFSEAMKKFEESDRIN